MERDQLGAAGALEPPGPAELQARLEGHTKPVTALFFDHEEEKAPRGRNRHLGRRNALVPARCFGDFPYRCRATSP